MSEKYAIIKLGGKQYKVVEGAKLQVERQDSLSVDVLAYSDGKTLQVGTPSLSDITVNASILEDKRGKKVEVRRFKSKSRYRKVKGHKQPLSVVEISSILAKGEKAPEKKETKSVAKSTTEAKVAKDVDAKSKKTVEKKETKSKAAPKKPAKKATSSSKKGSSSKASK